jgi:two-component system, chemotaxis family, protein-glutamate methylesterase/glutaminase
VSSVKPPLRVLVVDDSALSIDALTAALEADGDIAVIATAGDGRDAVAKVESLRPGLVAMDINMPVMDGLEAVERIMASRPTPILLLTGDPERRGERGIFDALSRGALDLIPKHIAAGGESQRAWLRDHVRLLASVPVVYRKRPVRRPDHGAVASRVAAGAGGVGLVASTGGPPVLADILGALPADYPLPILVVQHLAPGFAPHLASWLNGVSRLEVRIASHGLAVQGGTVYLAPDGAHLVLEASDRIGVDPHSPPVDGHRPSGTMLLASLAAVWGRRAIGVVLTGMGSDGVTGLDEIRRAGGTTIAQDEASSVVYGMPRTARERKAAASILPPTGIAEALVRRGRTGG